MFANPTLTCSSSRTSTGSPGRRSSTCFGNPPAPAGSWPSSTHRSSGSMRRTSAHRRSAPGRSSSGPGSGRLPRRRRRTPSTRPGPSSHGWVCVQHSSGATSSSSPMSGAVAARVRGGVPRPPGPRALQAPRPPRHDAVRPHAEIRYAHIAPGQSRLHLPVELQYPCWRRNPSGAGDVLGRLRWDEPSVTIRTEFFSRRRADSCILSGATVGTR